MGVYLLIQKYTLQFYACPVAGLPSCQKQGSFHCKMGFLKQRLPENTRMDTQKAPSRELYERKCNPITIKLEIWKFHKDSGLKKKNRKNLGNQDYPIGRESRDRVNHSQSEIGQDYWLCLDTQFPYYRGIGTNQTVSSSTDKTYCD